MFRTLGMKSEASVKVLRIDSNPVDDVVVLGPDMAQDDQYAGLSLDDALPAFLDFMLRAQSLEMLPDGARWSRL